MRGRSRVEDKSIETGKIGANFGATADNVGGHEKGTESGGGRDYNVRTHPVEDTPAA